MNVGRLKYFGTKEDAQALLDELGKVHAGFVGQASTSDLRHALKVSLESVLRAEFERQNLRAEYVANVRRDPNDETALLYSFRPKVMDAEHFEKVLGRPPVNDDLYRVNCPQAGQVGHGLCGWCEEHDMPRIVCGCVHLEPEQQDVEASPSGVHGADPARD